MGYILNESMAEIIGVIIGDGCIYCKNNHYSIEIVGNPHCEKRYYNHLSNLISICFNKNPSLSIRERGLRLKFYSKDAVLYLINNINLEHGKGKHARIKIPEKILKNDILPTLKGWGILSS